MYTIKSISDEGTYYLVKDWRKNRELWVSQEKMNRHPDWWFTSEGKAKQSLKTLLNVMDEYLSDEFYVVDDQGNETPLSVSELGFDYIPDYDDDIDACDKIQGSTNPNFDPDKMHFFYKHKYLGSCEPGNAGCPKLLELMESDPDVASMILDYMNSLGDPVFPVSEEDWGTPETDITKVDIEDLYNTFLQELDYEYRDFPDDFYVGGDYRLPDFEIFVGKVADDVRACGDIKASRTINKWNLNTKEYDTVEIPEDWNITTFTSDLDEEVNCVNCGKPLPYGESYCSRRYHDKYGFGYAECGDCYEEQWQEEFGNNDVEACDNVMASEICYRDKDNDDKVVALDVGMSDEDVEEMLAAHPSYYRSTLDIDATTEPKYFANMVSASSFDNAYDENDELYKYRVAGYLQKNLVGLMDEWYTNDFEEALEHASEMGGQGLYVEIENQIDGRWRKITPEEWEEAAEWGEYPDHIREDLAL